MGWPSGGTCTDPQTTGWENDLFAPSAVKIQIELDTAVLAREKVNFNFKIQAKATGRILASRSVSGMKKDVTDYLYGGDITRKMKLREKQKKGKKRMKAEGKVNITQDVFLKMMNND